MFCTVSRTAPRPPWNNLLRRSKLGEAARRGWCRRYNTWLTVLFEVSSNYEMDGCREREREREKGRKRAKARRRFNTMSTARTTTTTTTITTPFRTTFWTWSSRWLVVMHFPCTCTVSMEIGGGRLCRRPRGRSLAAAQGGSRNSL